MSDALDRTSCISHRQSVHFFVMYDDFLDIAKISEHQHKLAAFWRVLETKTNERIIYNEGLIKNAKDNGLPIPETDLWIEISYSEFSKRTLGVYKESSFKIAAVESERLGFSKSNVKQRPVNPLDPNSKQVDCKEYLLLTGVMQSVLNGGEMPTPVEFDSPLLNGYEKREKARKERKEKEKEKDTPVENDSPPVEFDRHGVENDSPPVEFDHFNNIVIESSSIKENKEKTTKNDASASQQSQTSPRKEKISSETKPLKEKKAAPPKTRKQPELPHIDEPDLSVLSEQEKKMYLLLRTQDQPIYLSWQPTQRNVYNNWLGVFGDAMTVDITEGIVNAVKRFEPIQPTTADFLSVRKYAFEQEKNRPEDKRYYKKRGFKLWDAAREWTGWKSQQAMDGQDESAPKNNQKMTREELIAKALSFPTRMDHTTPQYQELQNCMMYLQPNDRAEVTRQRIAKQMQQQKNQVSA